MKLLILAVAIVMLAGCAESPTGPEAEAARHGMDVTTWDRLVEVMQDGLVEDVRIDRTVRWVVVEIVSVPFGYTVYKAQETGYVSEFDAILDAAIDEFYAALPDSATGVE